MILNDWMALTLICILGAFSPGPSLLVILSLTASDGRKAGYISSAGHGFGIFTYAIMSATGLALVLKTHHYLFVSIQILGALFLLYLAFRILHSHFANVSANTSQEVISKKVSNRFFDGFLIAILNPKIGVFFLSLFSQFLIIGQTFRTHFGMAILAGTIDTVAYFIMVSLVSTPFMLKFFSTYKKSVECSFGFLLIVLAVSLCLKLIVDFR